MINNALDKYGTTPILSLKHNLSSTLINDYVSLSIFSGFSYPVFKVKSHVCDEILRETKDVVLLFVCLNNIPIFT